MRITILSLVGLFAITSFAGVHPMTEYKDKLFNYMHSYFPDVTNSSLPSVMLYPSDAGTGIVPSAVISPHSNIIPSVAPERPTISISELEYEIHILINVERARVGIPNLVYDSSLSIIARQHSEDMTSRDYFSHYSPEGLGPTDRAKMDGYDCYKSFGSYYYDGIAENIFQNWLYSSTTYINGSPTYNWNSQDELATSTVEGWMDSLGHRENILNEEYSNEGIGIAISEDGKVYITEDFW